ncbi:MAG: TetR/AcrR family transcriptional regulator [Blautia massiliensis (ex Durand et al. 2017)]|nr:TetR/AcrR family transcriptional regulator [Blautia wexlerae]NSD47133.1 TetR/AcrR family transcriptional regulator [Blautia wexlerae]NSD51570.1 TetR/AcrR family transcriptional regulator [Blautia wexlerae]NSK04266.1 TetR/AcrR family transcriptional regulator [Blautia wexlerae]
MNNKFFKLPVEKQQRIINAAYKVFSQNSYKKAPMSEIANEGGISKALLFHYFVNKKELYMYLWTNALDMTRKVITEYKTLETSDFFEMLKRSLLSKCSLMRSYPYIYAFSLSAYYETAEEIKETIQKSYSAASRTSEHIVFDKIDISGLRKDIDLRMMYTEILYAVDGYMLNKYRSGQIIADEIEQEITVMINFWRKVYTQE